MDWFVAVDITRYDANDLSTILTGVSVFLIFGGAYWLFIYVLSNERVGPDWFLRAYKKANGIFAFLLIIARDKDLGVKVLPVVVLFFWVFISVVCDIIEDKPSDLVRVENAIAQGRGQCMSGEYHYLEEVGVRNRNGGTDIFQYLHFRDGRKLLLGGFDSGICYRSPHIDSNIRRIIQKNMGTTRGVEIEICWMKDIFERRSESKYDGPEYGMCIYEISVRKKPKEPIN